jgi:hypothetical protein
MQVLCEIVCLFRPARLHNESCSCHSHLGTVLSTRVWVGAQQKAGKT